ncbi:hypothetical protein GQ600_5104 [Phytophthora cactorum]|nr:hypothetical protein GQ600_5104 [Phytophthora cactorum]
MDAGQIRRFPRNTIRNLQPPVRTQGSLTGEPPQYEYVETKAAVRETMVKLLDNSIPQAERTVEPLHLSTADVEAERDLPECAREWLLGDTKADGTHRTAFQDPGKEWEDFQYDEQMQIQVE